MGGNAAVVTVRDVGSHYVPPAQHEGGVELPVPPCGHVPGQAVRPGLDVVVILQVRTGKEALLTNTSGRHSA